MNEHEDIPENTREIRGHNVTPYVLRKQTSPPKWYVLIYVESIVVSKKKKTRTTAFSVR